MSSKNFGLHASTLGGNSWFSFIVSVSFRGALSNETAAPYPWCAISFSTHHVHAWNILHFFVYRKVLIVPSSKVGGVQKYASLFAINHYMYQYVILCCVPSFGCQVSSLVKWLNVHEGSGFTSTATGVTRISCIFIVRGELSCKLPYLSTSGWLRCELLASLFVMWDSI